MKAFEVAPKREVFGSVGSGDNKGFDDVGSGGA